MFTFKKKLTKKPFPLDMENQMKTCFKMQKYGVIGVANNWKKSALTWILNDKKITLDVSMQICPFESLLPKAFFISVIFYLHILLFELSEIKQF